MSTRPLVAPELLPVIDGFPPLSFSRETLPMIREGQQALFADRPSRAMPDVEVLERTIPGPGGAPPIRVLEYRPAEGRTSMPAVLHLHGGGHILGLPEMNDVRNAALATKLGCVVISVDYRLSPDAPFPAALEDGYAALQWLQREAQALGIDKERITIMGESAGGGMAAGVALMARDRGEITLHSQLLVYPMLDDRSSASDNPSTGEFIWTREHNSFAWSLLLDGHSGPEAAYAAPARMEDLRGLPQTYISVGALDLFLDEDIAYASRLIRAGVAVTLQVVPGAFHGFDAMSQGSIATDFTQSYFNWLARIWAEDPPAQVGSVAAAEPPVI